MASAVQEASPSRVTGEGRVDPVAIEARRAEAIPSGYNGVLHAIGLLVVSFVFIAIALSFVSNLGWWEFLVCPFGLVFANGVEWALHRGPLHHPVIPRTLYQRHTICHHGQFTHETMAISSWRELRLVMFPLWALPVFALIALPLPVFLLVQFASANTAAIFAATAVFYYLFYEVCHLTYHLPLTRPWLRSRFVSWLREHHQLHHDPRKMVEINFNVTVPVFDWLFRTRAARKS